MEANKKLFFKMETGSIIFLHRRNYERIGYHLVIKMTIDTLVMDYCFRVVLIAGCPIHMVCHQVVEISLGEVTCYKQEQ